jgi:hypothetical protein
MPELDPSEHSHGQIGAPPAGGLALATPTVTGVPAASRGEAAAAEPRAAEGRRATARGGASAGEGAGSVGEDRGRELNVVVQYLDVVLVVVATPVALALGAPAFGVLVAAIAWIAQRVLARADKRWVTRAAQPRTKLGLSVLASFGRIWLLAGAIVFAGVVGGRADGLTAAIMLFAAYSVAFAIRLLAGKPAPDRNLGVIR